MNDTDHNGGDVVKVNFGNKRVPCIRMVECECTLDSQTLPLSQCTCDGVKSEMKGAF